MSKTKKIAIVGAGLVGQRHIEAISVSTKAELCAIVDVTDESKQIAAQHQMPFYADLYSLLQSETVDGVLLSTPTGLHIEQAMICIEQRCPVLIEKPISITAQSAAELIDAAAKENIAVLVGHHRRHNPLMQKAKSLIVDGVIGEPRSAHGSCWLYKPDDYFDIAPWRKKLGAGPISVNLVHDIDLMRYLLGDVECVQASAAKSARGFENEDVAAAVLTFQSGLIATITVSDSIVAPWSWELTAGENPAYPKTAQSSLLIGGSEGALSIPDLTVWHHQGERSWWNPIAGMSLPGESSDPLVNQIEHFADVIAGVSEPLVSGLEGMKTLQVVEAIQASAATRETISIASAQ